MSTTKTHSAASATVTSADRNPTRSRETRVERAIPATRNKQTRIDAILKGAIDPHVHSGPSIAARALDHLDLVREMSQAGFAAVVTKDHDYAGVATAALITKHHPELRTKIFSG